MRVLFINANRFHQPWPVIPFGLGCVAAAAEGAGYEVRVLDLCFSKRPDADIRKAIEEFRPEVVGVSIRNIDNSAGFNTRFLLEDVRKDVIKSLKREFSGPIVIGGPAVGISAPEMLEYLDLELAVRGDGEIAVVELLRRLETGRELSGTPGLVRRIDGEIVEESAPAVSGCLDDLDFSRVYDHIDLTPYKAFNSPLQVQTKRGCALSCSYCTYNRIEGRRWRLRDPEKVADDIEKLVGKTGITHVEFTDSTFNLPLGHCKQVLKALVAKRLKLELRTMGLNPGAVDGELVDLMKAAGFRDVDLGAESLCDATLEGLGKRFRKESVLRAADLLHTRGIPVMWYLLVGGPGETGETLRETLETVSRTAAPWDLINVGIGLRVYKGSPVAERMLSEDPFCTTDNFLQPVAYEPEGISLERVKEMVKREALKCSNYFMYDEDEKTPESAQKLGTWLLKRFAPSQPGWRLFIVLRHLQKMTGINALRRLGFELFRKHAPERPVAPALLPVLPRPIAANLEGGIPMRRILPWEESLTAKPAKKLSRLRKWVRI